MYKGICSEKGIIVPDNFAFEYALKRVLESKEEQKEFVEWFYSGNWIKTDDDEE